MKSPVTTLCYIEQDDKYLMLHRIKKKNDLNEDKWVGIGGHAEEGESPEDCLLREAMEETGLSLTSYQFRGLVTFVSDKWGTEYMCLYTADGFEGEMIDCNEGCLEWIATVSYTHLDVYKRQIWMDILIRKNIRKKAMSISVPTGKSFVMMTAVCIWSIFPLIMTL